MSSGNDHALVRTVDEIRATGAAWVSEHELEWLCRQAEGALPVSGSPTLREARVIEVAERIVRIDDEWQNFPHSGYLSDQLGRAINDLRKALAAAGVGGGEPTGETN